MYLRQASSLASLQIKYWSEIRLKRTPVSFVNKKQTMKFARKSCISSFRNVNISSSTTPVASIQIYRINPKPNEIIVFPAQKKGNAVRCKMYFTGSDREKHAHVHMAWQGSVVTMWNENRKIQHNGNKWCVVSLNVLCVCLCVFDATQKLPQQFLELFFTHDDRVRTT